MSIGEISKPEIELKVQDARAKLAEIFADDNPMSRANKRYRAGKDDIAGGRKDTDNAKFYAEVEALNEVIFRVYDKVTEAVAAPLADLVIIDVQAEPVLNLQSS